MSHDPVLTSKNDEALMRLREKRHEIQAACLIFAAMPNRTPGLSYLCSLRLIMCSEWMNQDIERNMETEPKEEER